MSALRSTLLGAAHSSQLRRFAERSRGVRTIVDRFVAGSTEADALRTVTELAATGRLATLDFLGEDVATPEQAALTVHAYEALLAALGTAGLADRSEVSVKLSAIGQSLAVDGDKIALENARRICVAAQAVGTTVTLDAEDHTTTDATLAVLTQLRADFGWVGVVVQAYLRRAESDCRDLATGGSRIRLCKGAYAEPASVAYRSAAEVAGAYQRCLAILLAAGGYPMIATHDPAMITAAEHMITAAGRTADSYEMQMLMGVRTAEQRRLAAVGHRVRTYVPYGEQWYGYFMRRLAERPANLGFLLRALALRG